MDLAQLTAWRRQLHQHPELSFQEYQTSRFIAGQLQNMGIEVQLLEPTGVIGRLDFGKPGPVIALRADIDALPLQDAKEVPYKSKLAGVMHACGHDGHTAILLGTAQILSQSRNELSGGVVFIFQPGEEKPPGGAADIVAQGWLKGVDWVFGLHLWAGIPAGYVGLTAGPVMANADEFTIRITGKGGHGSMPQDSVDAVVVAAYLVTALQTIVSRSTNPLEPAVVSIGSIHGGSGFNIIAQEAVLTGTYRSLSAQVRTNIEERIREIAQGVCATYGAGCSVECRRGYPVVINPEAGVKLLRSAAAKVLGEKQILTMEPNMGGEDFGCYLEQAPGAFMFLGAALDNPYPHHHPCFDFKEEVMADGVKIMVEAVKQAGILKG